MAAKRYLADLKVAGKRLAGEHLLIINNWEETAFDAKSMEKLTDWDEVWELRRNIMLEWDDDENANLPPPPQPPQPEAASPPPELISTTNTTNAQQQRQKERSRLYLTKFDKDQTMQPLSDPVYEVCKRAKILDAQYQALKNQMKFKK